MNIDIKYFISIKWISWTGQTSAGQTGPWYSLNGDIVLYLNIHLYMIRSYMIVTFRLKIACDKTASVLFISVILKSSQIFLRISQSSVVPLWQEHCTRQAWQHKFTAICCAFSVPDPHSIWVRSGQIVVVVRF